MSDNNNTNKDNEKSIGDDVYCACCGRKLRSFGNRKLADGTLCKSCFYKFEPYISEQSVGLPSMTYDYLSAHYDEWQKEKDARDKTNSKKLLKACGIFVLIFVVLAVVVSGLNTSSNTSTSSNDFCYGYEKADYSKFNTSSNDKLMNTPIWIEGKLINYIPIENENATYYFGVVEDDDGNKWIPQLDVREELKDSTVEDTLKRYEKLLDSHVILCGYYAGYSSNNEMPGMYTAKIYDKAEDETLITGWGKVNDFSTEYVENYMQALAQQLLSKQDENGNRNDVYYSTNLKNTVENGNSGLYSYRDIGKNYHTYWIIDFDEECIYRFSDNGNNNECDKFKIESGTLNDYILFDYQINGNTISNALYFKYVNSPNCIMLQDENGNAIEFYSTSLSEARSLLDSKITINEY